MEFTVNESFNSNAKIKVIGVGGAGGNAVNRMIEEGLSGVEFISINTDAMALENNKAPQKHQIGQTITKGLGAGANPQIGRKAMEEDADVIKDVLEGSDMVFITAGMGGGTGTGAAPVIAQIAASMDILTVAIVTKPFIFEGKVRDRNAREGIIELKKDVDTIITIPNQKLMSIVDKNTSLMDAFRTADEVLHYSTKGISDLITIEGLVNLDFADVKTVLKGMGPALMGSGLGEGENRAAVAADSAMQSPLLDDISITGAKGVLVNITGGSDLSLYEISEAMDIFYKAVGEEEESNIIFGAVINPEMEGRLQITVMAAGFEEESEKQQKESKSSSHSFISDVQNKTKQQRKIKQMAISLPTEEKENKKEYVESEGKNRSDAGSEGNKKEKVEIVEVNKDECELNTAESSGTGNQQTGETGKVAGKEGQHKESSKEPELNSCMSGVVRERYKTKKRNILQNGSVMTQYEESVDIPTFLRKQMQ